MSAKYRHLSQLAAIGATLLLGISLSGCSLIPGMGDSNSNSNSNRSSDHSDNSDSKKDDSEESNSSTQQSAFDMRIGDCWNDPDEMSQVSDLEVVPCTTPHDNEVFALFNIKEDSYPGKSEVESIAQTKCEDYFEDYVGKAYGDSSLEIFPLYPTEGSWANMDDREVVCSAYDMSLAQLSESVNGSRL